MKTKGFTLVELLVVIAILAILATVSVVGYTTFITDANESVAVQELTQIRDYMTAKDYTDDNFSITTTNGLEFANDTEESYDAITDYVGTGKEVALTGTVAVDGTDVTYTIKDATAVWDTKTGKITIQE